MLLNKHVDVGDNIKQNDHEEDTVEGTESYGPFLLFKILNISKYWVAEDDIPYFLYGFNSSIVNNYLIV